MNVTFFPRHRQGETKQSTLSTSMCIALSYAAFLLICLILIMVIFFSSTNASRETYWSQQAAHLETDAATMHSYVTAMNTYTFQLLTDSTFVRLSHMDQSDMTELVATAAEVMKELSTRSFGLLNMPVTSSHIYLERSGYVIASSHFSEMEQYYRAYRNFQVSRYEEWLQLLASAPASGVFVDASACTGMPDSLFFFQRLETRLQPPDRAVIWFELDVPALRAMFLHEGTEGISVTISAADGTPLLHLGDELPGASPVYNEHGMADLGDYRFIRRYDDSGWSYVIALPHRLCDAAVGNFDSLAVGVLVLSLLAGATVVFLLVRRTLRPIHQLNTQLTQARDDNADLQRQIDAQRPALQSSYVRTLLSGHVSSAEEFAYMMRYLNLDGDYRYYVLFCIAHRQDSAADEPMSEYDTLAEHLEEYLAGQHPMYYYTTLDRSFVVLTAYDQNGPDPLMDLQARVVEMHDDLAAHHSLWFYAGVGTGCTQPQQLWESYEQARTAARYTAKHHIFLPYEYIRKDADSWYYPIEISAKLLHFITTGNQQQVTEMFALIYRENVQERSLAVPLLSLLLSDLKNTLLKARFQVPPPQSEAARAALNQLDERLYAAPTFPTLESCAAALCTFFTRTEVPSDPIPEIERYLQENFSDPSLCLSKLSDRFNISESYLSHLFKDRTGQNFSVYLEKLRMNEALRRLADKDCNLSTLYLDLGYTNPTTLRRAFKKNYGVSPSEMRQQLARQGAQA
ncbi:MAG: helix-turn-helix domain-containing protein [Aristaeellaceae bacterium]